MTEMPLRDVPGRLGALAYVLDMANAELAHALGMAMGTGFKQLAEALQSVGAVYVDAEQALTNWRLELRPQPGPTFDPVPSEDDDAR
jgi:hypothetical protein